MANWDVRKQSLEALHGPLEALAGQLDGVLKIIDDCIRVCEAEKADSYLTACAVTMLKGKRFGMCQYSLILDGYAQEAGACSRPFLEYWELLIYLRLDPSRHKLMPDKLPTAGVIAKEIGSEYKFYRDYLNNHASHKSFSESSIGHLGDDSQQLKLMPSFSESWLKFNLRFLFGVLLQFARESIIAIQTHFPGKVDKQTVAFEIHRELSRDFLEKTFDEKPKQSPSGLFSS